MTVYNQEIVKLKLKEETMRVEKINKAKEDIFRKRLSYQYRLIYDIGCQTGLRISDIVRMKKSILQIKEPTIIEQKTGKSKRIYIPKKLRQELIEYSKNNKTYIFQSKSKSGHLTRQAVFKHFKRIAHIIETDQNIGTHTMRKNYACKLLAKGKTFKYIKTKLNHEKLSDTLLYLIDEMEGK